MKHTKCQSSNDLFADLLWSFSIFLTSPLIATLGLSLNAPLAMVIDLIRQKKAFQLGFLFGCALVLAGFLIANIACAWEDAWERRTLAKLSEKCKPKASNADPNPLKIGDVESDDGSNGTVTI